MKKTFWLAIFVFSLINTSLFSQNKICLSKNQQDLITLPKSLKHNYTLADFSEAYQFYSTRVSKELKGKYCVFSKNSENQNHKNGKQPSYISEIIYLSQDDSSWYDLLYISESDYYLPQKNLKKIYCRDYLKFDDYGNCFIAVEQASNGIKGVLKYSPLLNSKDFFPVPDDFPIFKDFEIPSDGSCIFMNVKKITAEAGYQTFIFNTNDAQSSPEALFDFDVGGLSNPVYSPEKQAFYFLYHNSSLDAVCGLVVVRANNQIYSKDSLTFYEPDQITLGNYIDFWGNIFLYNEADKKLYLVNYNEKQWPSQIMQVFDKSDYIDAKYVKATEKLLIKNLTYPLYTAAIKSTPLGLYIKDKEGKEYLYDGNSLNSLTAAELEEAEEAYYKNLFFINNAEKIEARLENQNRFLIILLSLLGVIIICLSIVLSLTLLKRNNIHKKLLQKKMLAFQETERAKLSRDIHDSIVQDIRAIRLNTELIDVGQNEKALAQKARVIDDITQTIVKTRNICYNLTPAELMTHSQGDDAEIELISIIDSLCHQFYVKSKIPCAIQIDPNLVYPKFEKEVTLHLVRIFQEILNNIEKHSYATNVNVLVRNKSENQQNYLVLFIIDDGIGCNLQEVQKNRKKNHFGLQNMQKRMELIGGTIEFFSAENEGMKIKLTVKI